MKTKFSKNNRIAEIVAIALIIFIFPNDYKHLIPHGEMILAILSISLLIIGYVIYLPNIIPFIKKNLLYSLPFFITLISTVAHDGKIISALQGVILLLMVYYIGAVYKYKRRACIKIGEIVSFIILIINLILTIVYKGPITYTATAGRVYLIFEGGIGRLIICNLLLLFLGDEKRKLFGLYKSIHYILYILTIAVTPFSLTYIVGIVMMTVCAIISSIGKNYKKQYGVLSFMIPIVLIINIFVITAGAIPSQLSSLFKKTTTLSGRTTIWESAVKIINDNPLIGIGEYDSSHFLELTNVEGATHSHNQVLHILLSSGIVGASIYIIQLSRILRFRKASKENITKDTTLYAGYLLSMMIMGITMVPFDNFFYLASIIAIDNMRSCKIGDKNKPMLEGKSIVCEQKK